MKKVSRELSSKLKLLLVLNWRLKSTARSHLELTIEYVLDTLAIVSLAGIVVSHIIVLSDFIEEARAEGMELKEALVQAGLVRLRAVLVTVLPTVGGLIPLALTGGELWHPLTAVHIFGLMFATLLTLVLLPVLYFSSRVKP